VNPSIFEPLIIAEIMRDLEGLGLHPAVARTLDGAPLVITPSSLDWDYISSSLASVRLCRDAGQDTDDIICNFMDDALDAGLRYYMDEWSYETWVSIHQRLLVAALGPLALEA
jgi:hypothetical protein